MDSLSLLPCSSVPRTKVNDVALLGQKADKFISNTCIGTWIDSKDRCIGAVVIIIIQTSNKDDS